VLFDERYLTCVTCSIFAPKFINDTALLT